MDVVNHHFAVIDLNVPYVTIMIYVEHVKVVEHIHHIIHWLRCVPSLHHHQLLMIVMSVFDVMDVTYCQSSVFVTSVQHVPIMIYVHHVNQRECTLQNIP
jgi:hypothetical protein